MEDAPKNSAVDTTTDTTKDANNDPKAGSGSQAGPDSGAGAIQGSADQGSTDRGTTKESGESSDRNSSHDANRNSASPSAGKPPAAGTADRGEGSTLNPKLEELVKDLDRTVGQGLNLGSQRIEIVEDRHQPRLSDLVRSEHKQPQDVRAVQALRVQRRGRFRTSYEGTTLMENLAG